MRVTKPKSILSNIIPLLTLNADVETRVNISVSQKVSPLYLYLKYFI